MFVYEYSTPIWMFLDYMPVNITNIANVLWIFVECMAGSITNVENVLWMFVKCMHDCWPLISAGQETFKEHFKLVNVYSLFIYKQKWCFFLDV